MKLTRKTNSDGTITLSWAKIPGVDGYRFYSAGVFRSDTWDANRTSVKFSGGQEPYVVEAIVVTTWAVKDTGSSPEQPPKPPDPVPKPPAYKKVAPRTYNYAPANNSDPQFCIENQPGVVRRDDGMYTDESGAVYDSDGRDASGVRSRLTQVAGLRQANNSDGRGPCELYDGLTAWPGDPTKNTGSWEI